MADEPRDADPNPANAKDEDFVLDSGSVAFQPPADGTSHVSFSTADLTQPAAEATVDTPAQADADADAEGEQPTPAADDGEQHAGTSSQPEPKAKKKGQTLSERTAQLRKDVDTLTYQKHQTAREIGEATARLTKLRGELAAADKTTPVTSTPAQTSAQPAADLAMPEHPKYRDFDTDEAYEAAVAKWRTDVTAWQGKREEALETKIGKSLDTRLQAQRGDAEAEQAHTAMVKTLEAARAKHPDWREKSTALRDIRSSWYDPEHHGEVRTPFLSDLSQTLMAFGNEEGAELLHWLGSDPQRAQRLADLLPTRPIRDALVMAPSVIPLLDHFATDDGAQEFEALKGMHPVRLFQAIGAISARLSAAPRGSAQSAHPITAAHPAVKPPVGAAGVRGPAQTGAPPAFEDWKAAEDARELKERLRLAGVSA